MKKTKFTFLLIATISCFFFLFYSYLSIKLYKAHKTRGDLTNFAQAMWNTTQGRIMQNTFNYSVHNFWGERTMEIPDNSNIFGIHFNPILFLFVPIYFIFPDPRTLLVIQSFLIALGGVLIYLIALRRLRNIFVSIALSFSYLSFIGVVSSVLAEFHVSSLSIFFGLLLLCYLEKNKSRHFVIAFILFLTVQENTAIVAFALGLYLLLVKKTMRIGILITSLSLLYFIFAVKIAIPYFSNYKGYIFESVYGNQLGGNFKEIIINSIKNPALLFQSILTFQNFKYLAKLSYPVFPFVIFSPLVFALGLVGLIPNLLSSSQGLKSLTLHYEATSIPFIFYSSILGVNKLTKLINKRYQKKLFLFCSIVLLLLTFSQYRLLTPFKLNRELLFQNIYRQEDLELDNLIKLVPQEASISTQDYISGHLANRKRLYIFPVYYDKVDYLLLSVSQDTWPLEKDEHFTYINNIVKNPKYDIKYKSDNYILIKKIN